MKVGENFKALESLFPTNSFIQHPQMHTCCISNLKAANRTDFATSLEENLCSKLIGRAIEKVFSFPFRWESFRQIVFNLLIRSRALKLEINRWKSRRTTSSIMNNEMWCSSNSVLSLLSRNFYWMMMFDFPSYFVFRLCVNREDINVIKFHKKCCLRTRTGLLITPGNRQTFLPKSSGIFALANLMSIFKWFHTIAGVDDAIKHSLLLQ